MRKITAQPISNVLVPMSLTNNIFYHQPDDNFFNTIINLLSKYTRHSFSSYKRLIILKAIEKQMLRIGINDYNDYLLFLKKNQNKLAILFKNILVPTTQFFRDSDVFTELTKLVIPHIVNDTAPNQDIRIWVPGCSTGEEAYSLAIIFLEYMQKINHFFRIQIFATDINQHSLDVANRGKYAKEKCDYLNQERLHLYFNQESDHYVVKDKLKKVVEFIPHNIIQDFPLNNIDLISCRNVLIYLEPEMQDYINRIFYSGLRKNGTLVLGKHEFITNRLLFHPLHLKHKLFRKM